ncbi:MAG: hypothetical protein M1817_000981 [Caeruleum heppii]|nr:MAG: hypothetical protein M1817_000981 [Caeruleum heppii]
MSPDQLAIRNLMFPTFLLPAIPFRRRHNSADSMESSASTSSSTSTGSATDSPSDAVRRARSGYLSGHHSYLRCGRCSTDLCLTSQIISKGFTGRHGRAYLVSPSPLSTSSASSCYATPTTPHSSLANTYTHKAVPRQLVTGAHTVSDISCIFCGTVLGWKYVAAEDEAQRYKVGKYILETRKIRAAHCWEEDDGRFGLPPAELGGLAQKGDEEDDVEFDSQDEDECEDLFAGVWSPMLALRRRKGKRFLRPVEAS